jgi:hypothetical protein
LLKSLVSIKNLDVFSGDFVLYVTKHLLLFRVIKLKYFLASRSLITAELELELDPLAAAFLPHHDLVLMKLHLRLAYDNDHIDFAAPLDPFNFI